jgi:hypothetical protein
VHGEIADVATHLDATSHVLQAQAPVEPSRIRQRIM